MSEWYMSRRTNGSVHLKSRNRNSKAAQLKGKRVVVIDAELRVEPGIDDHVKCCCVRRVTVLVSLKNHCKSLTPETVVVVCSLELEAARLAWEEYSTLYTLELNDDFAHFLLQTASTIGFDHASSTNTPELGCRHSAHS